MRSRWPNQRVEKRDERRAEFCRPSRGVIVEWEVEELLFDKSRPEGHVCERVREKVAGRSVVKVVIEVPQTRSSRVWRWAETIDKLSLSSEQGQGERARQTHTPRHFGTYCTGSSRASSFTHSLTLDTSTIHPRLGLGIALRGAGPTASIIPLSSWRD